MNPVRSLLATGAVVLAVDDLPALAGEEESRLVRPLCASEAGEPAEANER